MVLALLVHVLNVEAEEMPEVAAPEATAAAAAVVKSSDGNGMFT